MPEINYEKRNAAVLESFVAFCKANPHLRFWQALAAWSGFTIFVAEKGTSPIAMTTINPELRDPFYFEGKDA